MLLSVQLDKIKKYMYNMKQLNFKLEMLYINDKEYIRILDLLQNKIFELNLEEYVCKNN